MKITPLFRKKFKKLAIDQRGIFTSNDLWAIISPSSEVDFYRQISKLIREELISKFVRGTYLAENFSIPHLVMNLRPNSYLSLEYALAYYNMIGTYSEAKIRPIAFERVRPIKSSTLDIEFKCLNSELDFGIEVVDGVRIANREKALLDTLYFYQKGAKFYFDIFSDIDLEQLNIELLLEYLSSYKNPKFVQFVKGYLND